MPVILSFDRERQEDGCEFKAILDHAADQAGKQNQLPSGSYLGPFAIKRDTETSSFIETSLSTCSFTGSTNVCVPIP